MKKPRLKNKLAFTLVELLIGVSLSLIVISAVLSSYVFLAKNFTRSLAIGSSNQPTLEAQGRRAINYFTQDVRMAIGITGTISASEVTLIIPTGSGTKNVTFYYNSGTTPASVYSVSVPPESLARIDRNTNTLLTLQTDILTCTFSYFDNLGYPYTAYVNYLSGIKKINLSLTAQTGSSTNGTLTPAYRVDSAPLLLRNTPLLY